MSGLGGFEREPYLTRLEATVLRTGTDGNRPFAVLDDTILYPEGGGQPADHGFLGAVAVLDVQRREGEIRHLLAAPVAEGPVTVTLDWERRFDHMQQHTGQHLLTAVAQDRFGWHTTSFHLGDAIADIELDTPVPSAGELERLEAAVAAEIRAARAVTGRRVTTGQMAELKVRSRGLPEGFQGDVRLVEIAGLDLNTCGGTHLASTAELECLKLLGAEALRGGARLTFAAGGRVRRILGECLGRNAQLRTLLGAPDEGLVAGLEARLEQVRSLERRTRSLEEELLAGVVEALASRPGHLVEQHFAGKDAGFLQRAGRQLAEAAPDKCAFLTAGQAGSCVFVLAAGVAVGAELAVLGREAAQLLGAKGGGSGQMFQGKAASLAGRDQVIALLRARLS
jgi:alanyl-tRNA synthetase